MPRVGDVQDPGLAGSAGGGSLSQEAVEQWNLQGRLADLQIVRLLSPLPNLVEVPPSPR